MSNLARQDDGWCGDGVARRGPCPQAVATPQGSRQTVWWVMTVVLAVIATALVLRWDESRLTREAVAQSAATSGLPPAGAQRVYAFSGQITAKSYGVFMVDVDSGTIWCYEIKRGLNDDLQMKLVSARSWIFDRYLEEFNVGEPIPAAVRAMVQQQRSHRSDSLDATGTQTATPEPAETPPPSGPAFPDVEVPDEKTE